MNNAKNGTKKSHTKFELFAGFLSIAITLAISINMKKTVEEIEFPNANVINTEYSHNNLLTVQSTSTKIKNCDFNGDEEINNIDINEIIEKVDSKKYDKNFDVNDDKKLNARDIEFCISRKK